MAESASSHPAPLSAHQPSRSVVSQTGIFGFLVVLAMAMVALSLTTGASPGALSNLLGHVLFDDPEAVAGAALRDRIVILDIRLPRALLGFLVGASLAMSGAVMQSLFRNPLADPGIVGVTSGAALAAVCVIIASAMLPSWLADWTGQLLLPLAAFGGGLLTTILLYRLSRRQGQTDVTTLLLAGIALSALAGALTGILVFAADDRQLRDITFWSLGSLAGASWEKLTATLPIMVSALFIMPRLAAGLNALTLGEAQAFHMGISVERLKQHAVICVAAATGAGVAVGGGIGFVGIIVPHLLRLVIGPDNRRLLPASALLGGAMLVGADMVARTVVAPAELPIGILTAFIGAPFFLWILLRKH